MGLLIALNMLAPGKLTGSNPLSFVVNLISQRESVLNFSSDYDPNYKQDNLWICRQHFNPI